MCYAASLVEGVPAGASVFCEVRWMPKNKGMAIYSMKFNIQRVCYYCYYCCCYYHTQQRHLIAERALATK